MTDKTAFISRALVDETTDKRVAILRRIAQGASISQAARDEGVSYKAAWQAIDTLSNLTGVALVEKTVGGAGGGGARVTAQGRTLLELADALARARAGVISAFSGALPEAAGGLGLRTSMRNLLPCRVAGIESPSAAHPSVRVGLLTAGGQRLWSRITRESADLLDVQPGRAVLVLAKATAVLVGHGEPPAEYPNVLPGRVERLSRGPREDEVTLSLDGDGRWVGFAVHPFARRKGQTAWAAFNESALVLALPS